ncbi:MAG: hypothetical protein GY795_25410 [Desulfobacterales bacterium]|nr:hypothetical protein [Desulfobacterales bacterium]
MTSDREKLLKLLVQLCEIYPDMRFGQLVINLAQWARGPDISAAWDATDEELIQAAEKNIQRYKNESGETSRK